MRTAVSLLFYSHLYLLIGRVSAQNENWRLTEYMLKFATEMFQYALEEPPDEAKTLPEYDFIVVGAGTAGCAVANRLTEIPEWQVLLLEAGGEENYIMDIPINAIRNQFSGINWNYRSVPSDVACLGLTNNQCVYPRGKVMGGSSVLNYMVHTRGNRRDFDEWEKLGNTGWGYDDILPYFLKSENLEIPELAKDKTYHSTGGYLTISYPPYHTPLAEAFLEAGREIGQPITDYNGKSQIGFSFVQTTTKNGTRWSASRGFLHPIRKRKNLNVKKRSQVTKVLLDPKTKAAYGVEFTRRGKRYIVRARKEVILSAGAINSPQLLMLSGVGPREHLEDMNIPVIKDLPVGFNLMDHMSVIGITHVVNQSVSLRTDTVLEDGKNLVDYFSLHKGPLSATGAAEALAFYDFDDPQDPDGDPDIELLFLGGSVVSDVALRRSFGISDNVYDAVYKPIEENHTWMVIPELLKPKSRGRIMLKDKNPMHKPLLYHGYLQHPQDMETTLKGIKLILKLGQTKAFQKYGSRLLDIPVPGCRSFQFGSDDYWRCVIRHLTFSIYHLSGTCKMAPRRDPGAVVDPRLSVYGVKNLRVIDASIIPVVPRAHTNAATVMIAEKGSDMIKDDWGVLHRKNLSGR
ncbi:Glucose dehydrogenase [FAD, quinone] [Blattella germanica]|nr:Glucose dehydrogenase [FAD, quinone] [Blattella germanica]